MLTVMDKNVEVDNGDYRVVLTYIGEGCCGDYNKADPEDYPHIRADVYRTEPNEDDVENGYIDSTCTGMNADISVEEATKYANSILTKFTKFRENLKYGLKNALSMAV